MLHQRAATICALIPAWLLDTTGLQAQQRQAVPITMVKRSVVEALCVCGIGSVACAFAVLGWFPHLRGRDSRSVPTASESSKI